MFSIVTISDSRSSGFNSDDSGKLLNKLVTEARFQVFEHSVVPDEEDQIKVIFINWSFVL